MAMRVVEFFEVIDVDHERGQGFSRSPLLRSKLIAHLAAKRSRLDEFQVMRIAGFALANEARLGRNNLGCALSRRCTDLRMGST